MPDDELPDPLAPTSSLPLQGSESCDASELRGLTDALGLEPALPDRDPLLGVDIGGVTIVRLIAEGGMGRVYEGLQQRPRRPVAVKVMRPGLFSKEGWQRFEQEAEVLGRLRHPSIAQVFSAGRCMVAGAAVPFFVMDYIPDAQPITRYVLQHVPSLRQRLELFQRVCEAVGHGHDKGVIHRDLKPGNILVEPSGLPKVIDFGIARCINDPQQMSSLTDVGQLIGTVQYMSPEQFAADPAQLGKPTDVYGLGMILYEILAGAPPYSLRGKNLLEAARVVSQQQPPPLCRLNTCVTPQLAQIVGKCLAKDQKQRYGDAGELAHAIAACVESELSAPPGPTPKSRNRTDSMMDVRSWTRVALTTCLICIVAIVGREFIPRVRPTTKDADLVVRASRDDLSKTPLTEKSSEPVAPSAADVPFDAAHAREVQEAWAKYLRVEVEITNSIGATLVVVPPGRFNVGDGDKVSHVTLSQPFWIGQTEVTQGQWRDVMGTEPWKGQTAASEGPDAAASYISAEDAVAFCTLLTDRERGSGRIGSDQQYRLPTEDEWEFACRAGSAAAYSFGDDSRQLDDYGWYGGGFDQQAKQFKRGGNVGDELHARDVRQKRPNAWRLYDMHGNVAEWAGDSRGESHRGVRGGDFVYSEWTCETARRATYPTGIRLSHIGFRFVLSPATTGRPGTTKATITQQAVGQRGVAADSPPPPAVAPFDATQALNHQKEWAAYLGLPVEATNSIGMTLVVIPPGGFIMGEAPAARRVTLAKPFLLGQTEVTLKQWREVMGDVPWKQSGLNPLTKPHVGDDDDMPATVMTWQEAMAFCERLAVRERAAGIIHQDQEYRLPTEAEWEFACRAGTVSRYSFGDDPGLLGEYGWYGAGWDNERNKPLSGGNTRDAMHVQPVRMKKPNPWLLYDMHGNATEWCSDIFIDHRPGVDTPGATALKEEALRASRGGHWSGIADIATSSFRAGWGEGYRGLAHGFRVVLTPSFTEQMAPPSTPRSQSTTTATPTTSLPAPPPAVAPFDATQARLHQDAWAKHLGIEVATTNSLGATLAIIPPGSFTMGEGDTAIRVSLTKPFYLGTHEVTNSQWKRVMHSLPSAWKEDERPVESITWNDAVEFCNRLSAMPEERAAGRIYRLPTNAEWEYACRAGTSTTFWFGDDESQLDRYAWFQGNSGRQTHPVGETAPNPWGLYDLHGNVFEWCNDWYEEYAEASVTDPQGPLLGLFRVRRGGGWYDSARDCRSANRYKSEPSYAYGHLGFRVAMNWVVPPESKSALPASSVTPRVSIATVVVTGTSVDSATGAAKE